MLKTLVSASIAAAGGIAVALLTGFVTATPSGLVGAEWYGLPLAWLFRLVVAPQYYPWRIDPWNLLIDVVFWAVLFLISLALADARRKSRTRRP